MSKLFHSIKIDGKKIPQKIVLGIETGNIISISCIICSPVTREYFGTIIQRLTFSIFYKSSTVFYTNDVSEEILSLVLDKVSL